MYIKTMPNIKIRPNEYINLCVNFADVNLMLKPDTP